MEESQIDLSKHNLTNISEIARTHGGNVTVLHVKEEKHCFALKIMSKSYLNDETRIQRTLNEKNAFNDLSHPGILKLVRTVKDDLYIGFLTELIYGCPLNKLLSIENKLNTDFVRFLGIQIAVILQYVHSKGYLYRDIKASNFIIDQSGRVKLIDLGFCKKVDKGRAYSFCGTLHAMAPEYFNNLKEGYSYEVDYYAFGILLYELVTGCPPFGYESPENEKLEKAILNGVTVDHLQKIKDKDLRDLIEYLLDKKADQRLGHSKGFDDIINHNFFKKYDTAEIEVFLAGTSLESLSFSNIEQECEQYLETIYLAGLRPETIEDTAADDPFKSAF